MTKSLWLSFRQSMPLKGGYYIVRQHYSGIMWTLDATRSLDWSEDRIERFIKNTGYAFYYPKCYSDGEDAKRTMRQMLSELHK